MGRVIVGTGTTKVRIGEDEILTISDNDLKISTLGSRNLLLQLSSTGNVGIGVFTPAAKLDIIGAIGLTTALPAGQFLRAKIEGEVLSGSEPFATISIFHSVAAGEIAGALRVVNSAGQGIIRCPGTNTAAPAPTGKGLPGAIVLQGASGTLNNVLVDDNGRLFVSSPFVPAQKILVDPMPMYRDEFWRLDSNLWTTAGTGAWSVTPSTDVGPAGINLTRGGLLRVRSGTAASDYVTLTAPAAFVNSRGARYRCRFYAFSIGSGPNDLAIELGLKPAGGWATRGGAGYYFAFNRAAFGTTDFFMVANNGAGGQSTAPVGTSGPSINKFFEVELTVSIDSITGAATVKAWQANLYTAVTFVVPAASSPLLADLVPGFAIYNITASAETEYVDLIEYETVRAAQ